MDRLWITAAASPSLQWLGPSNDAICACPQVLLDITTLLHQVYDLTRRPQRSRKRKDDLLPLMRCNKVVKTALEVLCPQSVPCYTEVPLLRLSAAHNLQQAWKEARYNPCYRICRRVLYRQCLECTDGVAACRENDVQQLRL